MSVSARKQTGFTIVELLIVIVVIAILAAISVVAYTGIQNRANDTAVQSDITNFAKKVMAYYAEHGEYPAGGTTALPSGFGPFKLALSSYSTSVYNFYYCTGTVSGDPVFAVGAVSASGNKFYYSSINGGLKTYTGTWNQSAQNCPGMLPSVTGYTYTYGHHGTNGWNAWPK
jgi:prepilin-type N-terminal cleavage/methylation domain-containing protein